MGSLLELGREGGGGEKKRERRKGERRKSVEERQKLFFKDQFSQCRQTLDGMQFEAKGTKYKYTKPEGKRVNLASKRKHVMSESQ